MDFFFYVLFQVIHCINYCVSKIISNHLVKLARINVWRCVDISIWVTNHNRTEDWSMLTIEKGTLSGQPVDSIFPLQPWLYARSMDMYLKTFMSTKRANECSLLLIHSSWASHQDLPEVKLRILTQIITISFLSH